jgi:hypothetical protein
MNAVGLQHVDDPTIIAWMHGDEPDNRQAGGKAVPLTTIWNDYETLRVADPTRPVLMNLGQGVANEKFGGRALEYDQYPPYLNGCDIASYDVYPIANYKDNTGPGGKTVLRDDGDEMLWLVARGVMRLRRWSDFRKPVWNVIECTHISNPTRKATPHQIRAEVWMSIIHGSQGICWFVHQWEPEKNDAQLLADPEMREVVRRINHEVLALAPVINAGRALDPTTQVEVESGDCEFFSSNAIAAMTRRTADALHIFTVNMSNRQVTAEIELTLLKAAIGDNGKVRRETVKYVGTATVLGEDREIQFTGGEAKDVFGAHDVHIYRVELPAE